MLVQPGGAERRKKVKKTFKIILFSAALIAANIHGQTDWLHFRGMCDASAMEMLNDDLFVAGNDEDNVLRVYSRSRQGLPVQVLDFSSFYALKKRSMEIDLEGAARIGNRIYWISSHGANSKGKVQASRHRLFATEVFTTSDGEPRLRPAGKLYSGLVRDLAADPNYASFNLAAAAHKPPKAPGALNIEGLAPTPEGHLLVGFRNPIPGGKALIARLLNPEAVTSGEKVQFGKPQFLDLGGLGVRSITPYKKGYLIVAGPFDAEGGPSQLHYWDGKAADTEKLSARLGGNPEGISVIREGQQDELLFVISDDGALKVGGSECKKLKDDNLKTFRAYTLPLGLELSSSNSQ